MRFERRSFCLQGLSSYTLSSTNSSAPHSDVGLAGQRGDRAKTECRAGAVRCQRRGQGWAGVGSVSSPGGGNSAQANFVLK